MKLIASGLTDPGLVRRNNEDNYWLDEKSGLLLVADGMGGHAAGEVASQMAVDIVRRELAGQGILENGQVDPSKPLHLSSEAHALSQAVSRANTGIFEASRAKMETSGMGTTIVAVLVSDKKFAVVHVGDSRLYLFRNNRLSQMTRDHSVVAEQVAKGLITVNEAEKSNVKNVLTKALGVAPEVQADVDEHPLRAGDVFLLCTDGLCRMVEDAEISRELARGFSPGEMCHNLVRLANARGGMDNVTVVAGVVGREGFWRRVNKFFPKSKP